MLIGEAIKSLVHMTETNVRELAKKTGLSYQAVYLACADSKPKQGMTVGTACKLLDALDYKLVATPKEKVIEDTDVEINLTQEGVRKMNRVCIVCGKRIPKTQYSQLTPKGRVCQKCINDAFSTKGDNDD